MHTIALFHTTMLTGTEDAYFICSLASMLTKNGSKVILICQEPEPENFDFITEAYRFKTETQVLYKLFARHSAYDLSHPNKEECVYFRPDCGSIIPTFSGYETPFSKDKAIETITDLELENYINRNIRALKKIYKLISFDAFISLWNSPGGTIVKRSFSKSMPLSIVADNTGTLSKTANKNEYALRTEGLSAATRIIIHNASDLDNIRLFHADTARTQVILAPHCINTSALFSKETNADQTQKTIEEIDKALQHTANGYTSAALKALYEIKKLSDIDIWAKTTGNVNYMLPDSDTAKKLKTYLQGNEHTIFIPASLDRRTGIHDTLIALPLIADKYPTLRVLIAGYGKDRALIEKMALSLCDGDMQMVKEYLKLLAQGCPNVPGSKLIDSLSGDKLKVYQKKAALLKDHIQFCGNIPFELQTLIQQNSRITAILTLNQKASPLELLRAMSCGCIPIINNMAEYTDITDRATDSGAVILKTQPENHIYEFAACVIKAFTYSTKEITQIANLTWKYIDENHSWTTNIKYYL